MYAIVQDGAHQYRVRTGDRIWVASRKADPGAQLVFDKILACGGAEGKDIRIGQPLVAGARVVAEVLGAVKGQKVMTHKYRRRKKSHVRRGHRQKAIEVKILTVEA